jgi:hypothetical protein
VANLQELELCFNSKQLWLLCDLPQGRSGVSKAAGSAVDYPAGCLTDGFSLWVPGLPRKHLIAVNQGVKSYWLNLSLNNKRILTIKAYYEFI